MKGKVRPIVPVLATCLFPVLSWLSEVELASWPPPLAYLIEYALSRHCLLPGPHWETEDTFHLWSNPTHLPVAGQPYLEMIREL